MMRGTTAHKFCLRFYELPCADHAKRQGLCRRFAETRDCRGIAVSPLAVWGCERASSPLPARYLLMLQETKADDAVNEAVQQVAFADRILLNKARLRCRAHPAPLPWRHALPFGAPPASSSALCSSHPYLSPADGRTSQTDLVTKEELRAVREEIFSINSFAEVIETVQSKVDLNRILGVSSFSIEKTLEVDPQFLGEEGAAEEEECKDAACTDAGHAHSHGAARGVRHAACGMRRAARGLRPAARARKPSGCQLENRAA